MKFHEFKAHQTSAMQDSAHVSIVEIANSAIQVENDLDLARAATAFLKAHREFVQSLADRDIQQWRLAGV